ncbi:hypothetical protein EPJ74_02490 [Brachyspira aalborgi]|uniref:Uncharacterized protein n=1 Tax=Brachyspira aalborgi TaxID=29522 RepID=A0A5C8GGZ2_9SPIR|nr:hypothetical protein [Brachyspira aalborgi]TXJ61124.1 hypothetical protein EPJ74_02490 [Brachyspira aalborgi]
MEQLYLEFNKKGLEKKLDLLLKIAKEKNGDMEEAFIEFADGYIKGEMDLPVFLQAIHVSMTISGGMPNSIVRYQELLKSILKVKEYMINNNKDLDKIVNIYELLIYIYDTMYNFDEMIKISKELLEIDNKNKVALLHLVGQGESIDYAKNLIDNHFSPKIESAIILHNSLCYEADECINSIQLLHIKSMLLYVKNKNPNIIIDEKSFIDEIEKLSKEEMKELFKYIDKIDSLDKKSILSKIDEIINFYKYLIDIIKPYGSYIDYINQKYGGIDKLVHMYFWHYHTYSMAHINLELFQNSIAVQYKQRYAISQDIEDKNKYIKLLEESIKNYSGVNKNLLKDPIINLYNIYYADKEYEKCEKLLFKHSISLKEDCDYNIMFGKLIYQKDKNKDSAKKSLEYFRKAIEQLKSIDTASFKYAMVDILDDVIPLIYEMEEKEYIFENNSKVLLQNMYFYHRSKEIFITKAYIVAYNIKAYELCKEIILDCLANSKTIDKEILIYYIKSLYYLNMDNGKEVEKIINNNLADFNIYKDTLVNLINEIAGKTVIYNTIEIKNKKVLISLYEIMSVSRKELIVIRLFDYVRNADGYANIKIDKETKEKKISKIARWKGENVKINYKENEYILCYHFHTSSEVQYKDGKSVKFSEDGSNNRIKNIRRLPDENWIAINQIRDTLAHRINENDTDVNEAVRTTKKAREFIEENFTSIIECLFNVIKENGLLTDDKFNSEDF